MPQSTVWYIPIMVGVVPNMVGVVPIMVGVVPIMVGVVPSCTAEHNAACIVWRGMQNQNGVQPYGVQGSDSDFDRNEWVIYPPPPLGCH